MSQILIAGAGPVGLIMAAESARYGVQVRIVYRSPHPTATSRRLERRFLGLTPESAAAFIAYTT